MLRSLLLYLSTQGSVRNFVETSSVTGRLTSRFVAGKTLDQEIAVIRRLRQENILATLDCLGENVSSAAEAQGSRDAYLTALNRLETERLGATVSVKLTQLGLDLGLDVCRSNLELLVARAQAIGSRVEIDMESSGYIDRTLTLIREMHQRYASVRAVIQAYLKRSEADIQGLSEARIPVRLVKGAYKEPANLAIQNKSAVDASFVRLMRQLLESGTDPAIATHDDRIVEQAVEHVRTRGTGAERFEFQMLYGIRRDLQRRLVQEGYRIRLYVPYGIAWYPYFMRRLAERPANVFFLARNLLRK